jgi:hypothetical protein
MNPERKRRIEECAYHLWEKAGRPDGRDLEFWDQARELVGMEESGPAGTVRVGTAAPNHGKGRIAKAKQPENLGEPPKPIDQGGRTSPPRRRTRR